MPADEPEPPDRPEEFDGRESSSDEPIDDAEETTVIEEAVVVDDAAAPSATESVDRPEPEEPRWWPRTDPGRPLRPEPWARPSVAPAPPIEPVPDLLVPDLAAEEPAPSEPAEPPREPPEPSPEPAPAARTQPAFPPEPRIQLETEAKPPVYSLPHPSDDPISLRGDIPRAVELPLIDTHGLARLTLLDAVDAIWPDGTPDFAVWLAENLGLLEDPLGFTLKPQDPVTWAPDRPVGEVFAMDPAPLDIPGNLATSDLGGAAVLVRAQVDAADTDGLGALLSAAAAAQAQTAVWVCPRIDEDLRQTLRWIGGDPSANVRLYGLEMYLVKIGDSPTAPLFDAVVSPGAP
jgi:hypothetical protein